MNTAAKIQPIRNSFSLSRFIIGVTARAIYFLLYELCLMLIIRIILEKLNRMTYRRDKMVIKIKSKKKL
jgi:hypothetical protein